ncbi:MAG TPA: hypothetical protein VL201_02450, partial [Patescibacteria group bacterium]|nr:hypothetical protein [Patescibacteria group bacterium]
MKQTISCFFLLIFSTFIYSEFPVCLHTKGALLKVCGADQIIIRSSDQTKRWVMHATHLVIQVRCGKIYINGKPLLINDMVILGNE